jgi:hypothetical protein
LNSDENSNPLPHRRRAYRYYDLIVAAFVTVLLCSNLIGAGKAQVDLPWLGTFWCWNIFLSDFLYFW